MITENPMRETPWNGMDVSMNLSENSPAKSYFAYTTENEQFPEEIEDTRTAETSNESRNVAKERTESSLTISTYQTVMSFITELPQRIMNRVADGLSFHVESSESEIPAKKPYMSKAHNKQSSTDIARGRGRGRGRSQLRRSGVSQARHRQERIRQRLSADIMDDLHMWEEFHELEYDDMPSTPSVDENGRQIRYGTNGVVKEPLSRFPFAFKICEFRHKKQKPKNKHRNSDEIKISTKVRYVPGLLKANDACRRDEDDGDSELETRMFRNRLYSDRSVDSEDSCCIVFETNSDSEFDTDYSTTDDENEDEATNNGSKLKVRFSRNPTIHRMIKWDYAYRAARRGPWEQMARDRERFKCRINSIANILDPILLPEHRSEIWRHRFALEMNSD